MLMPVVVGFLILYYYWRYRHKLLTRPLDLAEVRDILKQYFAYYNILPASDKVHFEQRVVHFIQEKRFIPRGFRKVTLEMKVLIAASAVQLTFGLPEVILQHFNKILIYPRQYFSVITKSYHKGEVNPGVGAIVLSWESFLEGYAKPHDSFNLGLHEMAHALKLENLIDNEEFGFFPEKIMEQWRQQAALVIQNVQDGQNLFFRPYATTNEDEFFAVAVENFFERPKVFYEQFPMLYTTLVLLLNQDPLKKMGREH
jgi:Mlc titration factor MtfA (ptsG expression regulator)